MYLIKGDVNDGDYLYSECKDLDEEALNLLKIIKSRGLDIRDLYEDYWSEHMDSQGFKTKWGFPLEHMDYVSGVIPFDSAPGIPVHSIESIRKIEIIEEL